MKILDLLKIPELKNIDLNDPNTSILHSKVIQNKKFLKKIYIDFYNQFKNSVKVNIEKKVLVELGSGGGFIKEIIPNTLASDVIPISNIDISFTANAMPFKNNSIDAFFLLNVFHHFNDPEACLKEMNRCLKTNGKIIMTEPANTLWGSLIQRYIHYEPFDINGTWHLEKKGPLTTGNSALPWIIFIRDKAKFENKFSGLKIIKINLHTPFRYLASGGVSYRQVVPTFFYGLIRGLEIILSPFNRFIALFQTIEIIKV